jgi:hypothetical protein
VFDDGPSNITAARAEGYRAYLINDQLSLAAALEEVLECELTLRAAASVTNSSASLTSSPAEFKDSLAFASFDISVKSALSIVTKPTRMAQDSKPSIGDYWSTLSFAARKDWLKRAQ